MSKYSLISAKWSKDTNSPIYNILAVSWRLLTSFDIHCEAIFH